MNARDFAKLERQVVGELRAAGVVVGNDPIGTYPYVCAAAGFSFMFSSWRSTVAVYGRFDDPTQAARRGGNRFSGKYNLHLGKVGAEKQQREAAGRQVVAHLLEACMVPLTREQAELALLDATLDDFLSSERKHGAAAVVVAPTEGTKR